ncbi:SidA/IucD/PvdA family monooxygenase [Millisia brevis]|uniref:SidA/IucD/PvdA family monooxygenase n=1 Tax=Millisia brevis TaxID=264148 RepID=UPI000830C95B
MVVVGAGPKGIAVAVKAAVLRDAGLPAPRVIIVERRVIGANWTAAGGWTDGSQRLGTSPEKDLGFPYRSAEFRGFNRAVDQAAQRFSWASYLVAAGTFGEWVDRGRPAPRHREWARYLQWAADQAGVEVVTGEVTGLSIEDGRWRVDLGAHGDALTADAVMVTGPGSAVSDWESLGPRVVGPASFWRSVVARAVPSAARTAVIGAGETAGAILHEMSRQEVASISVVAPRASLFTRGEGYFENRVFTDSVRWESLSITQRREVIDRADRGVLSTRVMDEIRLDGRIAHLEGRVRSARSAADGIRLGIDTSAGPIERDFDWVIDARGTRDLWMLDLLDAGARDRLERAIGGPASLDRLQLSVGRDLAVEGLFPQLFTPSLAALRQGPGFPNLSCLGLLADRICAGIVRAPQEITHDQNTEDDAADPRPSAERRQGWTLV